MSKIGTVQSVAPDKKTILIDGVWYNAGKVAAYLPEATGTTVEYNVDETNTLVFIRPNSKPAPAKAKAQGGYNPPPPGVEKRTYKPSFQPKPGFDAGRTESIIKQVIFKVSGQIASNFTYGSVDEAMTTFKEIHDKLTEAYKEYLK